MGHPNSNIHTVLQHLVVLFLVSLFVLSSHVQARHLLAIKGPHHEYAMVGTFSSSRTRLYGGKASISVWNPAVSREGDFSASSLSVVISEGAFVQAGWIVNPQQYGDFQSRFYAYWTVDNGTNTGCYDLDCEGFVLLSKSNPLGNPIEHVSKLGAAEQSFLDILIFQGQTTGDWILSVQGTQIGYWPASLFEGFPSGAKRLSWGGQIYDSVGSGRHTDTDMGNGLFPDVGTNHASAVCSLQYIDNSNTLRPFKQDMLRLIVTNPRCYDAQFTTATTTDNGICFLFGGSGRNPGCP